MRNRINHTISGFFSLLEFSWLVSISWQQEILQKNICQSYVYGGIKRFCWQHTSSCSTFSQIAFLRGVRIIFGFKSGVIMTWIGIINSKEKIVHNRKWLYEKTNIIESLPSESMLFFLLDRVDRFSWWALDETSSPTRSKSGSTEAWMNESI